MLNTELFRHIKALSLPVASVVVVPSLLVRFFPQTAFDMLLRHPLIGRGTAILLFGCGFVFFVVTLRTFISVGKGTLAPWDPTHHLVTQGVYRRTRNPMISSVLFMILAEALWTNRVSLFGWTVLFAVANSIYFKVWEEPNLVRRFGTDYEAYRRRVPMWIPGVPGIGRNKGGPTPVRRS